MKRIRYIAHLGLIGIISLAQLARADISTDLVQATGPLSNGVPEVAVGRLQAMLDQNLPDQEWRAVAERLGEAFVASKQPNNTLRLLGDARLRDSPTAKFWRAQALADVQRWAEALPIYEKLAANTSLSFRADAAFGLAETLRALGSRDQALEKLVALFREQKWVIPARLRAAELLIDKGNAIEARRLLDETRPKSTAQRKERHLLRARLEMISGRPEKAIASFQSLIRKSEGATHDVIVAALFGIADAELQLKTPEAGADVLEDYIDHHPQDVDLARLFAKLDELYSAQRKPSRAQLERWMRDPAQPRRGVARWYLARLELRAGHRDRALEYFSDLLRDGAKTLPPEVFATALLEFAKLKLEDRHFDEALAILDNLRAIQSTPGLLDRINLLSAQANYFARRFDKAAATYEQVAHSNSPFSGLAFFDAAAGWLQLAEHDRFLADYNEFEKHGGEEASCAELRLEEALVQAANDDKRAAQSLRQFIRDFPSNSRISEAWVTLAELAFHAAPPQLDEARKDLVRATETKPTAAAVERADYLVIWIEDASEANEAKVIELANRFLKQHPDSSLAPDVRMKLAETYYRRQDFPNAQTQFELLGQANPTGPLAEKALFFAAESAVSSMAAGALEHAIVLLDQVVHMNGELKWAARNEQAVIERKLGKPQDALSLYEEVLKSDARPAEKREALCARGDIFFEASGPENYQRAIEAYDQLATDTEAPIHWRNQALFKKGLCLEKKGDRAGALETFYRVVENEQRPDRKPELFWYYKAGFNAARILEEDSKWESAAAIYQRLAGAGGSRSEEAKARLTRLRLEHFLWAD